MAYAFMKKGIYFLAAAGLLLVSAPAYAQTAPSSGVSGNTSNNWSGYVATGSTYTGVNGSWVVPAASAVSGTALSADAAWVGIGGFQTHDLIQAGTEAEVQNGSVIYQAWYEVLPAGQVQVPLKIHAGDSVTVTLNEKTPGIWHLVFMNNTTRQGYQTSIAYASSHTSVEWIEEMPVGEFGNTETYVPLDQFGTIQFTNAYAMTDTGTQTLASSAVQPMTMMNSNRVALATPSGIGSDGQSFSVSRTEAAVTAQPLQGTQGRAWRRDGEGVSSFVPGTAHQERILIQQQIIRQVVTPVITRNGDTVTIQLFLRRG
ncbi:MAG: Peptidase family [Parcubacteria group bacterium]|nr:Peptidase family [Parcubacteria group bacterium]